VSCSHADYVLFALTIFPWASGDLTVFKSNRLYILLFQAWSVA